MTNQSVTNEASIYKYFAMIPNIADDDLDLYEYRLYGHYWRVCGANNKPCIEAERTTYTHCKMSQNTFRKARQGLMDKGFITMTEAPTPNEKGKKGTSANIVLNDIWMENITRYSPQKHVNESSEMRLTQSNESFGMRIPPMNESSGSPKNNPSIKTKDKKNLADKSAGDVSLDTHAAAIAEIIKAHLDSGVTDPGAYANKTKRKQALGLIEAGHSPDDVRQYIEFLKRDKFWQAKGVTMQAIVNNLAVWKLVHKPPQPKRHPQETEFTQEMRDKAVPPPPEVLEFMRKFGASEDEIKMMYPKKDTA